MQVTPRRPALTAPHRDAASSATPWLDRLLRRIPHRRPSAASSAGDEKFTDALERELLERVIRSRGW